MSQQDNFKNGRGCLGVVALLMVILLVGGFSLNAVVNAKVLSNPTGAKL